MGKPKPAETKTTGTQNQQYNQQATQDQTNRGSAQTGAVNIGQETGRNVTTGDTTTETESQRQQRQEAETRARQTGTSRDTTTGTSTTGQRSDQTSTTSGGSRNEYQWNFKPNTADSDLFRKRIAEFEGVQDPTISFNAAKQRENLLRMAQNPLGPYTTPESRQKQAEAGLQTIAQNEGQAYLQDAFNRSQQKLQAIGLQGELSRQMDPISQLMGTSQSQTQTGTGTTAGTTTTDQTRLGETAQDTVSNTLSNLFSQDSTQGRQLSQQVSDFARDTLGINVGYSETEDEMHGESTGSGASSGTSSGTQLYTPSTPSTASQVIGGVGSVLGAI